MSNAASVAATAAAAGVLSPRRKQPSVPNDASGSAPVARTPVSSPSIPDITPTRNTAPLTTNGCPASVSVSPSVAIAAAASSLAVQVASALGTTSTLLAGACMKCKTLVAISRDHLFRCEHCSAVYHRECLVQNDQTFLDKWRKENPDEDPTRWHWKFDCLQCKKAINQPYRPILESPEAVTGRWFNKYGLFEPFVPLFALCVVQLGYLMPALTMDHGPTSWNPFQDLFTVVLPRTGPWLLMVYIAWAVRLTRGGNPSSLHTLATIAFCFSLLGFTLEFWLRLSSAYATWIPVYIIWALCTWSTVHINRQINLNRRVLRWDPQ
jgi:hypothetical protein